MNPLIGRRVLVVEDQTLIAAALAALLEDFGCIVVGPTGRLTNALSLIANNTIDAAILSGLVSNDKCEVVISALAQRGTPWMLASGYDRHSINDRFGGVISVEKPYQADQVYQALCKILRVGDRSGVGHPTLAKPRGGEAMPCGVEVHSHA